MGWFKLIKNNMKENRKKVKINESDWTALMSDALRCRSSKGGKYMAERKAFLKNKKK